MKHRVDITRPRRKGQIWKCSKSGSQSRKAGSVPGTGATAGPALEGRVGERPGAGAVPTCSSSCTILRLLFSTAWMSGERPLLMSCRRAGRSLSLSKLCPISPPISQLLGPPSQSGQTLEVLPHALVRSPRKSRPLGVPPRPPSSSRPHPLGPGLLTTASMSAPRSSKSRTASGHSMFTATCRAVSPAVQEDSVNLGLGLNLKSCQTAPPGAGVGAHHRNCGPPDPQCPGLHCPAGPASRSGCGAHTPGGPLSGHGGPVPWGWHQPSLAAGPQMAMW